MTDFKVGDRVVTVQSLNLGTQILFPVNATGRVIEVNDLGDIKVDWDDKSITRTAWTGNWFFDKAPEYAPGTRIRGVVEGVTKVVSGANEPWLDVGNGHCFPLSKLIDVTVVKTLPTSEGSVIQTGVSLYCLTQDNKDGIEGNSWKLVKGLGLRWLNANEIPDNWELRFDAGA